MRVVAVAAVGVVLLGGSSIARADPAGEKALGSVDAALGKAKSLYSEFDVTTAETGKADKKLAFREYRKGDKLLHEWTSSDLKGTKMLFTGTDTYVYLPAFGKVRKIADHEQGSMFGLAFSMHDFTRQNRYGDRYAAMLAVDGPSQWSLVLTLKPGQTSEYAKIEMKVAKDHAVPTELAYFNIEGKSVKLETRSNYSCQADVCTAGEIKMVDKKTGLSTKLVRMKVKINDAMSDDLFVKKSLGD